MARIKLLTACALAFAVSLAGTSAAAQEPVNQLTYFTFSAPFELPGGKTLPAGKYVFRIMDSPSNRHVVHVMSEDQREMHATLMAIPAGRAKATTTLTMTTKNPTTMTTMATNRVTTTPMTRSPRMASLTRMTRP